MGRIRDEFYRNIQTDYRLFESDSVIFQFFREEHERMYRQFLEKKRNGPAGCGNRRSCSGRGRKRRKPLSASFF